MRVLVQNVLRSDISIDSKTVSSIGKGVLMFVGFKESDTDEVVEKMVHKIINERVFQDSNGLTNLSLNDINGEILSVSQFTLYADLKKGLRPSFTKVKKLDEAKRLYDYFNELLIKEFPNRVKLGVFQADMKVSLINDGPFTILYDSEELFHL